MTVKLPIEIIKKEKWYVASCPVLDVASQGRIIKKAKDNLSEAVTLFLTSCIARGTLDQVLRKCGFQLVDHSTKTKRTVGVSKEKFIYIPLEFLSDRG